MGGQFRRIFWLSFANHLRKLPIFANYTLYVLEEDTMTHEKCQQRGFQNIYLLPQRRFVLALPHHLIHSCNVKHCLYEKKTTAKWQFSVFSQAFFFLAQSWQVPFLLLSNGGSRHNHETLCQVYNLIVGPYLNVLQES